MARDPQVDFGEVETKTIHHLADAIELLAEARNVTGHGFVADHCTNAINEAKKAIQLSLGVEHGS